jgi:hypothetical protein
MKNEEIINRKMLSIKKEQMLSTEFGFSLKEKCWYKQENFNKYPK